MSYWAAGCCLPVNLWFVPCPGSPSCAGTFFATTAEWTTILGKTPSVGDVYKYDDGSRENPCVYCGKFQEEFAGGQAPPTGGFEKQDDCNDDDCPKPYFFFIPCNDACRTYTMAATKDVWDTLLGITIDPSDPSSYAGTWLFERTDGDPCCHVDEDGNPIEGDPCNKFCGRLSEAGTTTGLCFDSSNANVTPQCEKCSPSGNQVQVIGCTNCNSTSGLSFTLKSNGCSDPECIPCRPQQCKRALAGGGTGNSKLKYRGRKTLMFNNWSISSKENYCDGIRTRVNAVCNNTFDLTVIVEYTVYLQGNAIVKDFQNPGDLPNLLNQHSKNPCITIDSVQIPTATLTHEATKSTAYMQSALGDCGSGGIVTSGFRSSFVKERMTNPTFQVVDIGGPNESGALSNSWMQKRIGLQRDAIGGEEWTECNLDGGIPSPNDYICPGVINQNSCLMNFMTCSGNFGIKIKHTRTDISEEWDNTASEDGSPDNTTTTPVDEDFILHISTGMLMKDALELCCCDDLPSWDSMYYTDFPVIDTLFGVLSYNGSDNSNLSNRDSNYMQQFKEDTDGLFRLRSVFDDGDGEWGHGSDNIASNNTTISGVGAYLDKTNKKPVYNFDNTRNFACDIVSKSEQTPLWQYDSNSYVDADGDPVLERQTIARDIVNGGYTNLTDIPLDTDDADYNKRIIKMDYSISETLLSFECIADDNPNLPGSGCEDGVIDVP